jgi:hypothetical protein
MINFPTLNNHKLFGQNALSIELNIIDEGTKIAVEIISNKQNFLEKFTNQIEILVQINCNATFYNFTSKEDRFSIPKENLFGRVEVLKLAVVKAETTIEINNSNDSFFNEIYQLEKGQIISDFKIESFTIDEESNNSETIVRFNYKEEQEEPIEINPELDHILVTFNDFDLAQKIELLEKINSDLAMSTIPTPAIISAIEKAKDDPIYYQDFAWYQNLNKQLEEFDETISREMDSIETFELVFNKLWIIDRVKKGINVYLNEE